MTWIWRYLATGAVAVGMALTLGACGGGSSSPTSPSPSPGLQATFSSINSQIFQVRCVSCHNTAGSAVNGGLNLESSVAYQNLVNTPSTEQPGLRRVNPGDPDASYLVRKLEGTAGITGARMPLGGAPLTSDQINTIRQWITNGAQNN